MPSLQVKTQHHWKFFLHLLGKNLCLNICGYEHFLFGQGTICKVTIIVKSLLVCVWTAPMPKLPLPLNYMFRLLLFSVDDHLSASSVNCLCNLLQKNFKTRANHLHLWSILLGLNSTTDMEDLCKYKLIVRIFKQISSENIYPN